MAASLLFAKVVGSVNWSTTPKNSVQTRFPASFSGVGVVTTALGVSNYSNAGYVSSLWNVFTPTCDLQIPSGSKKMTAVHTWTLVQWRNTLSLNEVLHAPSRRLTQLQEHNDEVLPLWREVVSVKMGSRGGFCRWQECYRLYLVSGFHTWQKKGWFFNPWVQNFPDISNLSSKINDFFLLLQHFRIHKNLCYVCK